MYLDGDRFTALFQHPYTNYDEICLGLHLICSNQAKRYANHDQDAASEALVKCIENITRFTPALGTAFNYFSTIAFQTMRNVWQSNHRRGRRNVTNVNLRNVYADEPWRKYKYNEVQDNADNRQRGTGHHYRPK